jgi:hypothetical protein
MALKFTIDDPVEVPAPLRPEYKKGGDGKYHLALEGDPPKEFPPLVEANRKVTEFRDSNVQLMKKLAAFDGLDADAAKAALAKVAAGDADDVAKLKLDLAEAKSAATTAAQKTDALVLRSAVSNAFVAMGGRVDATDYIVGKAPFSAQPDGTLKPHDGAPLTVEEWLVTQLEASAFAFHPSKGGGATGAKPGAVLGARSDVRTLTNPTPQELGAAASDIKAGKVKVAYVITTDANKKSARGMTESHSSFDTAKAATEKMAVKAEKLGWKRREPRRAFAPKPDAFTTLPAAPAAAKAKK